LLAGIDVDPEGLFLRIRNLLNQHHDLFSFAIPLIASENIVSPAVREAICSDFAHRYAEGWTGERVYAGCQFVDEVELICIELMKKLFRADFADVRPISGVVANLTLYTAFARPLDTFMALSVATGGHISMAPLMGKSGVFLGGTAGAVKGFNIEYLPLDEGEMNIDVDAALKKIREVKPQLVLCGASVFLFPHPVKELVDTVNEVGGKLIYDAAHVAGLICNGYFQDPLREGVEAMSMSTHKTLPGPQHGAVVAKAEHEEVIKRAVFPGLTSNHHLHNVAGLAITLVEMLKFGKKYAGQVIKNSKALAESLYESGFDVLAEHKGFTESHTILIDVVNLKDKVGLGADVEKLLEKANIILNRNMLPWDVREGRHYKNPGGIRLGTSELTRLGMKEGEMVQIAEFMERILLDGEKPEKVREEVKDFRSEFQKVHYCFESATKAYEYIKIH